MLYDSTWWLSLENILNNPILENDEYYKIRIETRFPLEIILHKLICVVANASHFSRVRINLYITSIIYILFIYISFYLGKKELKSPSLGLLYSFCCIQTVYSVWLSFPIFTPKIIGFTLYPLALYALTTHEEKVNYYYGRSKNRTWEILSNISGEKLNTKDDDQISQTTSSSNTTQKP